MSPRSRTSPGKPVAAPPPAKPVTDGIAPPGKLDEESRDSAITGSTRSLTRRVMGLDVLASRTKKKAR
jgi:hypothetical protein